MLTVANLIGAIGTIAYSTLCILLFAMRLAGKPEIGRRIGLAQTILGILWVGSLLWTATRLERSTLYYLQVVLMLLFFVIELLLDYVFRFDFRQVRWMVIVYVTLFCAATGGMLGVTAQAGPWWTGIAAVLYVAMVTLAFVQRKVTGT